MEDVNITFIILEISKDLVRFDYASREDVFDW
jgi:hypothetical protein